MQTGVTYVFLWNRIDSDIKDWIWRDKMIVNKRYFISNICLDWIKQPAVYRIRVYWHFTTARVVVCKQIRVNIGLFDLCLFTVYTESQLNLSAELKTNVCRQGEACEKMCMSVTCGKIVTGATGIQSAKQQVGKGSTWPSSQSTLSICNSWPISFNQRLRTF